MNRSIIVYTSRFVAQLVKKTYRYTRSFAQILILLFSHSATDLTETFLSTVQQWIQYSAVFDSFTITGSLLMETWTKRHSTVLGIPYHRKVDEIA